MGSIPRLLTFGNSEWLWQATVLHWVWSCVHRTFINQFVLLCISIAWGVSLCSCLLLVARLPNLTFYFSSKQRHIYSHEGKNTQIFADNSTLAVNPSYIASWLSLLSRTPRVAPFLPKTDPLINALSKVSIVCIII